MVILLGIDMVFWDIIGKCFDVFIYQFMGGFICDKVYVYGIFSEKIGVKVMKVGL